MIDFLYSKLYELLKSTDDLIQFVRALDNKVEIVIPNHNELPNDDFGKFSASMCRFKFKPHEQPYETFSWPGYVYYKDPDGKLVEMVEQANEARNNFSEAIKSFKESATTTSKPVLALCEYHRSVGKNLPIIGSPDRIKIRQLTRSIRTFKNASRVTFSHDVKNEVTNFDPSQLIEDFNALGFIKQAAELGMFKKGELKKVHPPTERWRVNVHYGTPTPQKAHVALPVFLTGEKPEVRGISSGSIPEKRKRTTSANKKKLVPVVEQYGVFKYE